MALTGAKKTFFVVLMLCVAALFLEEAGLYSNPFTSTNKDVIKALVLCPTTVHPQMTCPHSPSGVLPLSVEPPYSCRLQEIQRRCKERDIRDDFQRSDRFKYGKNMPPLMCELPKVASTTWQAVLMKLNGFKGDVTEELIHKYAYSQFPHESLSSVSKKEASLVLAHYTTFMITRHPFERLVSAYYDKFTDRSDMRSYRKRFGMEIAKDQAADFLHGINLESVIGDLVALKTSRAYTSLDKKEQDEVIRYRSVLKTGEISFQQFIKYLLTFTRNVNTHKMDVHWRPQVMLCQPCALNYSMVLRFENLVHESNHLLEFVQRGLEMNFTFPGSNKPATQNPVTTKALQLISEADVNRLRDLYADDFYILGHDPYRYSGKK